MDPKENDRELRAPYMTGWTVIGNPNTGDPKPIVDTKLIDATVEWMATEVERHKVLHHDKAAKAWFERLGFQAALGGLILVASERNDRNDTIEEVYRFSEPVLCAFRKLTGKTVRWGKNDRYWVAVTAKQGRKA
jgi:hypothetical protein